MKVVDKYLNFESNFNKNKKKFIEDEGKTTEDLNIKKDLEYMAGKMKSFTEEEALVGLLFKYKRAGYNTRLIFRFREVYKDIVRWIKDRQMIIDPQKYIDYQKKEIKKLPSKKYQELKKEIIKNQGDLPSSFGYNRDPILNSLK